MASLIEELITTLSSQHDHYKELLILSEEKGNIVTKNEIDILQQITAAETAIIGKNQKLEQKREEIVKNIGIVLNEDYKKLTITKIAGIINSEEESRKLLKIRDELKETLDSLKEKNERNKSLIQTSLDYIDFSVNLIREGAQDALQSELVPELSRNFFDTKQ